MLLPLGRSSTVISVLGSSLNLKLCVVHSFLKGVDKITPGVPAKALKATSKLADLEDIFGVSPFARKYRELLKTACHWSMTVETLDARAQTLEEIFDSSEI